MYSNIISFFNLFYPHFFFNSVSMLSGARNAKNAELAQQIFARIELKSPDDSSYLLAARVLLANTLGLSGDRSGAAINRIKLQQTKTRKIVGLSWTVVDGKVFVSERQQVHRRSHLIVWLEISSSWSNASTMEWNRPTTETNNREIKSMRSQTRFVLDHTRTKWSWNCRVRSLRTQWANSYCF